MSSGDIHPNPGSMSSVSSQFSATLSTCISALVFDSENRPHHPLFVLNNVQTVSKLDILHTELIDIDILAFTETWLSQSPHMTWTDPEGGGGGGKGVQTPENSPKYRVSEQYWSGSPEKSQSYQASIQCWDIIGPSAKRHLNGVSLAGR